MQPRREELSAEQVHIWTCEPQAIRDVDLLETYRDLMTSDERAKEDRFRFGKDRHSCRVTRALLRETLSRYSEVAPRDWRFVTNRFGRPEIAPALASLPLRFNLSHTDGLIACAVALDRDIGVDVENLTRSGETVRIANRYFSGVEVQRLRALPAAEQRERFFHYWTLKESYIKARGMGLSLPLDRFSFLLEDEAPIRISIEPDLADDPTTWQFELRRPSPVHLLALSVRRGAAGDLTVVARASVPLA